MRNITMNVVSFMAKNAFDVTTDMGILRNLLIEEKFVDPSNCRIIKPEGTYIISYSLNLKSNTPQRDIMFTFDKVRFFKSEEVFKWFIKNRTPIINIHLITVTKDGISVSVVKVRKDIKNYRVVPNNKNNTKFTIGIESVIPSIEEFKCNPVDVINKFNVTLTPSFHKEGKNVLSRIRNNKILYSNFGKRLSDHIGRRITYKEFVKKYIPMATSYFKYGNEWETSEFKEFIENNNTRWYPENQ